MLVLHSLLLIDLQTPESRKLQFWPLLDGFKGPVDDVVHFAYSAKVAGGSKGLPTGRVTMYTSSIGHLCITANWLCLKSDHYIQVLLYKQTTSV